MPDYFGGDAGAAWKNAQPQTAFIRVVSGQSRTIRLDRPIELTDVQKAEVRQDPYVQACFQTWQKRKRQVKARYGTFEAERNWRAAAVDAIVRINPGARRRLRALKLKNSSQARSIGFTPMMNPLTKKIQRTYVSTDQCLFCVVYRIRSERFKTVSSRKRHEGRWHLSNISGKKPSRCPDVGCGEMIYGPIHWDNHLRNCHIDPSI
jgi:hypothetical protein